MFGNPIFGTTRTSTRQIVRMESVGGRLVGVPRLGSVAMIAVYAPGCSANDLVIREKAAEGNSTLLQIFAPSCLRENLVQAALFLRRGAPHVRFAKSDGGGWVEGRLQTIPVPTSNKLDRSAIPLPAIVVDEFGLIQLFGDQAKEMAPAGVRPSWTPDLRTRISRSGWHLLWPAVGLVIFVLLSSSVHKIATLGGRG
jgi:hypothetical protein